MLLRAIFITPVLLMTACSSNLSPHKSTSKPVIKYAKENSRIVPVNSISSSSNQCVDNFNFLRQAGDPKYNDFSKQYIKVGNGYNFLNVNKNIMDADAKEVYAMKLDMKLDTLCSKVNYAGYQVIRQKIKELGDI